MEEEPLGTGGGLYYLKEFVSEDEDVLFLYGDVFFDIDICRMEKFHVNHKAGITAFVHPNSHPYDSDVMEVDKDECVIEILSKKVERTEWYYNLVNAALYIINASVIHDLTELKKTDFEKEILKNRIQKYNDVFGYRSSEFVKDAGTEERLLSIEKDISNGYINKKNLKHPQKCVFLDRDGTINKHKGLIFKEEDFELIDDVARAVKMINCSEYLVICITNQPVVARGLCEIEDVNRIHKKMETLLGQGGAYLDDIIYCPHHPDKGFPEENPIYKVECDCRKPKIGMLLKMAEKYHISLQESWFIGDTTVDIMTGINAGMHTILVHTGECGKDKKYDVSAEYEADTIVDAIKIITER